jgi:hypothetical protein
MTIASQASCSASHYRSPIAGPAAVLSIVAVTAQSFFNISPERVMTRAVFLASFSSRMTFPGEESMPDNGTRVLNGLRRGGSARLLLPLAAAAFMCGAPFPAHATPQQGTFVTFDIPGGAGFTFVNGINPAGAIAGWTFDGTMVLGFVRAPNGTVSTIAVPGSTGTLVGAGAEPFAGPPINPAGAITGWYFDTSGATHGFVRAPDGMFTTFDAPGGVNGTAFLCCITPEGAVVGISYDANFAGHGFVRSPSGTFAGFDPPGFTSTIPSGVNPAGAISGYYLDASNVQHGFLRARDGTITTFDVPGSAGFGTQPNGINTSGAIVGTFFDTNFSGHGFLRSPVGTITTFDVPGSTGFGTTPVAINPAGATVGTYQGADFNFHGFLRAADGAFTTLDPPATAGTAGTSVGVINPAGVITGFYNDATSGAAHGFIFLPRP